MVLPYLYDMASAVEMQKIAPLFGLLELFVMILTG
jgi:hypothetical protein